MSTVGCVETMIEEYIRHQEQDDQRYRTNELLAMSCRLLAVNVVGPRSRPYFH